MGAKGRARFFKLPCRVLPRGIFQLGKSTFLQTSQPSSAHISRAVACGRSGSWPPGSKDIPDSCAPTIGAQPVAETSANARWFFCTIPTPHPKPRGKAFDPYSMQPTTPYLIQTVKPSCSEYWNGAVGVRSSVTLTQLIHRHRQCRSHRPHRGRSRFRPALGQDRPKLFQVRCSTPCYGGS